MEVQLGDFHFCLVFKAIKLEKSSRELVEMKGKESNG